MLQCCLELDPCFHVPLSLSGDPTTKDTANDFIRKGKDQLNGNGLNNTKMDELAEEHE